MGNYACGALLTDEEYTGLMRCIRVNTAVTVGFLHKQIPDVMGLTDHGTRLSPGERERWRGLGGALGKAGGGRGGRWGGPLGAGLDNEKGNDGESGEREDDQDQQSMTWHT